MRKRLHVRPALVWQVRLDKDAQDEKVVVLVIKIGNRKDVYRR